MEDIVLNIAVVKNKNKNMIGGKGTSNEVFGV